MQHVFKKGKYMLWTIKRLNEHLAKGREELGSKIAYARLRQIAAREKIQNIMVVK